jgi:two-component system LytT family response regulator
MIRAYLVDDEPLALSRLRRLIEERDDVTIIGSSSNPVAAVSDVQRARPDVLFLDIEMPGLSGFDLLQRLGGPHPPVIFTTAYDRYALDAFAVDSIDYLLKPIEARELARALAKLARLAGGGDRLDLTDVLERMRALLAQPATEYLTRVAARTGDRVEFVDVPDVTYFYAKDKLTFAVTREKHYAIDPSIAELEQQLPPRRWIRIHRATLVSVNAVKELRSWFGRTLLVRLKDGTRLHVARDRAAGVRAKLGV